MSFRRRFPQLDDDHCAEISEHAAENGLRHHAADIGAGEQDDGADHADDGAGPFRRGAESSSNRQAFIDSEPPKPPSTEASRLARPLERNS